MGLAVIIIVTVVIVLGLGMLILTLMRRSQKVVPDAARKAATGGRAVAVDDAGKPVVESPADDEAPRDGAAFEAVLREELEDQGH